MAIGKYDLTEKEKEILVPYFKEVIDTFANNLEQWLDEGLDLCDKNVSPSNMKEVLTLLGWEEIRFDTNGWEPDAWIDFSHDDYDFNVQVYYSGYSFQIILYPQLKEGE